MGRGQLRPHQASSFVHASVAKCVDGALRYPRIDVCSSRMFL
jgi:hypothetical protein